MKFKVYVLVLCGLLTVTGCSEAKVTLSNNKGVNTQEIEKKDNVANETLNVDGIIEKEKISDEEQASVDTLYWMNGTYGILIERNNWDIKYLTGLAPEASDVSSEVKQMLNEWWGIENKEDLDEMIKWLLEEGQSKELLDDYNIMKLDMFTRDKVVEIVKGTEDEARILAIYDSYVAHGDNAIKAWDLSRAIQLIQSGYKCGYYEYNETIEKSLEVAKQLQGIYTSWDDMMESYLWGYQYWSGENIEDETTEAYMRKQVYDQLKEQEDSPYQLDWNMTLTVDYALENKVEVLR